MWTTLSQMKTRNRWNSIDVHMLYCFFFFTACHQNASIMDRNKSLTSSNRLVKYFWFFSFSLVSLTTSYFPADHVFLPRLHEPMIGGTPLPMTSSHSLTRRRTDTVATRYHTTILLLWSTRFIRGKNKGKMPLRMRVDGFADGGTHISHHKRADRAIMYITLHTRQKQGQNAIAHACGWVCRW